MEHWVGPIQFSQSIKALSIELSAFERDLGPFLARPLHPYRQLLEDATQLLHDLFDACRATPVTDMEWQRLAATNDRLGSAVEEMKVGRAACARMTQPVP